MFGDLCIAGSLVVYDQAREPKLPYSSLMCLFSWAAPAIASCMLSAVLAQCHSSLAIAMMEESGEFTAGA